MRSGDRRRLSSLREFTMASSFDLLLRLCRRTVRKGSAFPAGTVFESSEATPREIRGIASVQLQSRPESRRLSALCGGGAAGRRYSISITLSLVAVSFVLSPAAVLAQDPTASPSPMVSAQQTPKVPTVAID